MKTLAILVFAVFVLIFILEILNAFYEAMLRGQAQTRIQREDPSIFFRIVDFLRAVVIYVMSVAQISALWFHELAHAGMSLFAGAMPRIVMCKGGGFAQPRPWPFPGGQALLGIGMTFWLGFTAMAPLVFGSLIVYGAIYGLTPLGEGADTAAWLEAVTAASAAELPRLALDGCALLVTSILSAKIWQMGLIFLLSLAIANAITPSSVDFIVARWSLPAYAAAVLAAGALLPRSPWLLIGAGVAVWLFWLLVLLQRFPERHRDTGFTYFFAAFGSGSLLLGILGTTSLLAGAPLAGLSTGSAFALLLLLTSVTTYLFFLAFMVALSLLSFSLSPILAGFMNIPSELKRVFTGIAICEERRMMFQDTCDACGSSLEAFQQQGCGYNG